MRTRPTSIAALALFAILPAWSRADGPSIDERLAPGATAESVRAAVEGRGETVVTVGHEPDCSEIVYALTGREVSFPTAGFAEVEL